MAAKTETEAARMVRNLRSGGGPLINLTPEQVGDIVATFAPYGRKARAEYFARLKARADQYPCEYD